MPNPSRVLTDRLGKKSHNQVPQSILAGIERQLAAAPADYADPIHAHSETRHHIYPTKDTVGEK